MTNPEERKCMKDVFYLSRDYQLPGGGVRWWKTQMECNGTFPEGGGTPSCQPDG